MPEGWGIDEWRAHAHPDPATPELAPGVDSPPDEISRREFVKLLGASAALAGLAACTRRPTEKILPYVTQPPEERPGVPLHYATAMPLDGMATGLLVTSRDGRPVKVEGNPDHPASLGASGIYEQASVLQLYDPHRARSVRRRGRASASWADFAAAFAPGVLASQVGARGAGLHILCEPTSSSTTAAMLARVRERWPESHVYFWAPLERESALAGAQALFAAPLLPQYDFTRADVVASVGANFLARGPYHLRWARDFAERRRIGAPSDAMNRLWVAEAMPSPTGSIADHRLAVRSADAPRLLAALLQLVQRGGASAGATAGASHTDATAVSDASLSSSARAWLEAAAADLRASAGRSIVLAGESQPPAAHAIAYAINAALGNLGATVRFSASPVLDAGAPNHGVAALRTLAAAIRARQVGALVIVGTNAAYTAPSDLSLGTLVRTVPQTAYVGSYADETAAITEWLVPAAHYLEGWDDARAYDGTASIVQPLIAPLTGGRTPAEVLAVLAGSGNASAHSLVRDTWRTRAASEDFEEWWEGALRRGTIEGSASVLATAPAMHPDALSAARAEALEVPDARAIELVLDQSPVVYDGRFANVAWLQELSDPVTKLTWDNAALMSTSTAASLGAASGDVVEIRRGAQSLRVAALVVPGHADRSLTLRVGYGRAGAEAIARGVGANAYLLSVAEPARAGEAIAVSRARDAAGAALRHALATTQTHFTLEGRAIALETTLAAYRAHPEFTRSRKGRVLSLYEPERDDTLPQWAMTIDMSLCTGCSACVIACQAENNIPVVGKDGVLRGREMHWLRIDRYHTGAPDAPRVVNQPMLCQHCEKAPCEYVCPVNATVHSADGLNEMIYNRCVGTRFCSNNCPYKVRRFNWFDYRKELDAEVALAMNPDVTVRERGVMEKCTFCVQRIRRRQIDASVSNDPALAHDVITACAQACPTHAIIFGSLTAHDSEVARRRAEPRSYAVLHELGTEPRVEYLARVRNASDALEGPA